MLLLFVGFASQKATILSNMAYKSVTVYRSNNLGKKRSKHDINDSAKNKSSNNMAGFIVPAVVVLSSAVVDKGKGKEAKKKTKGKPKIELRCWKPLPGDQRTKVTGEAQQKESGPQQGSIRSNRNFRVNGACLYKVVAAYNAPKADHTGYVEIEVAHDHSCEDVAVRSTASNVCPTSWQRPGQALRASRIEAHLILPDGTPVSTDWRFP
jgi:hypothetical protein